MTWAVGRVIVLQYSAVQSRPVIARLRDYGSAIPQSLQTGQPKISQSLMALDSTCCRIARLLQTRNSQGPSPERYRKI